MWGVGCGVVCGGRCSFRATYWKETGYPLCTLALLSDGFDWVEFCRQGVARGLVL